LERGTLDSVDKIEITCEVESLGGRGYSGAGSARGSSGFATTGRMTGLRTSVRSLEPVFRLPMPASARGLGTSSRSSSGGVSSSGVGGGAARSTGVSTGYGSSGGGSSSRFGTRSPGSTSYGGTQILFIVPNGSAVKKGDLLVELDSAPLRDRLDAQYLNAERAQADQIQANAAYENQKTRNETALADAQLQVKLATLTLDQLNDNDVGTFRIASDQVDMQIREALAAQLIQETKTKGVEMLYGLGYESKGEVAAERLNLLSAERALAIQLSGRKDVVQYQYERYKLQLNGALETAKRNVDQVVLNNEASLAQAKARKDAADRVAEKEQELLRKYEEQLDKCKIYAPRDGIVGYESQRGFMSSYSRVYEGAIVRQRQKLLTLPVLDRMQVKTSVHESVRNEVKVGMSATIRVDGVPEGVYRGTVSSVSVMPDAGNIFDSDTKVYETVVSIDRKVTRLKPGMTAVVEIHADQLKDVLAVPVQAVVEIDGDNWCYISANGDIERRLVTLGRTNERYVEIRDGLSQGETVVLNTASIPDDQRDHERTISPER
jgi:HlyD family secretion protein